VTLIPAHEPFCLFFPICQSQCGLRKNANRWQFRRNWKDPVSRQHVMECDRETGV
jgi:hypothetical protein